MFLSLQLIATKCCRTVAFLALVVVMLFGNNALAQDHLNDQAALVPPQPKLYIGDLMNVDWRNASIVDSMTTVEAFAKTDKGHDSLFTAIRANPQDYPLHQLENPQHKESDEHRAWEYQMKRMPVRVVALTDVANHLKVSFTSDLDSVIFCKTGKATAQIAIQNTSTKPLPNFTLNFENIPGMNVRQITAVQDQTGGTLRPISRRKMGFISNGLDVGQGSQFLIEFIVDCNGQGGSAAHPDFEGKTIRPGWTLEFVGYSLDYSAAQLYKIIGRGSTDQSLFVGMEREQQ